jgi:hypothetical protein
MSSLETPADPDVAINHGVGADDRVFADHNSILARLSTPGRLSDDTKIADRNPRADLHVWEYP